jgi:hypothetical protein
LAIGTSVIPVHAGEQILLHGLVGTTFVTSSSDAVISVQGSLLTALGPGTATIIVHEWFCEPVNNVQPASCPLLQVTVK